MIKVAIFGADTPLSGELIRILAMHPDVELVAAQARGMEGVPLSDVHHGLIGETDLAFTASVDFSKCDVLFLASPMNTADMTELHRSRPDLKIIALPQAPLHSTGVEEVVFGLPEIYRKALVRGGAVAQVPDPFVSMALVALFPFAANLLLNGPVKMQVQAPAAIIEESDLDANVKDIRTQLKAVQQSFGSELSLSAEPSDARRSALMNITFDSPLKLNQVLDIINIYDDHRFAFATTAQTGVSEVAGTNKCVIGVSMPQEGTVNLSVAADCRMRGGAGEAVHIMNLMFGLHEKTGLYLKAIDFDRY